MSDRTYQPSTAQQALLKQCGNYLSPSMSNHQLNHMYQLVKGCILQCLSLGNWSKHTTIRVKAWMGVLDKQQFDCVELSNRCNYARLLHLMMECQYMSKPFTCMPQKNVPIMSKQQYQSILQDVERSYKQSKNNSRKSSKIASPSASCVSRSTSKRYGTLNKTKNWSRSTFDTTLTKQKLSAMCSKSKIQMNKQQQQLAQSRTKSDLRVDIGQLLRNQERVHSEHESVQKQVEYGDNFQVAGLKMSNFISLQLKQFIDRHPSKSRKNNLTQNKSHPIQNYQKSPDQVIENLRLKVSQAQERYWQSSSINELGTPKYLQAIRNNPYASLAISQEDAENSHRSPCDCWCGVFNKHKL